jgi:hypothetical protein
MISRKLHVRVGAASIEFVTSHGEVLMVVRPCRHNRAMNEEWLSVDELEVLVDQLHSMLDFLRERPAAEAITTVRPHKALS